MTRTPGLELITPVDPQLLNENGEKTDAVTNNPVSVVSQRSSVVSRNVEKLPLKHSEVAIAKRNHIAFHKKHHTSSLEHLRKTKLKKNNRPHMSRSWKYSRLGNLNNQTLYKRSLILTKKLPANVDQMELELDGFVCICPEHYKGKKCERKGLLFASKFALQMMLLYSYLKIMEIYGNENVLKMMIYTTSHKIN